MLTIKGLEEGVTCLGDTLLLCSRLGSLQATLRPVCRLGNYSSNCRTHHCFAEWAEGGRNVKNARLVFEVTLIMCLGVI
jgi:hypothetical protein